MLLLKKHLKSQYAISSTTVALASLHSTTSGINKRDRVLNKTEHPPVSINIIIATTPHNSKDMISLIKIFQSLTFVDPVEQAPVQRVQQWIMCDNGFFFDVCFEKSNCYVMHVGSRLLLDEYDQV